MQTCYSLEHIPGLTARPVISVGNFDGVHLGHQALINALVGRAQSLSCPSLVLTFTPHPLNLLRPERPVAQIMPLNQRLDLLKQLGVDVVLCLSFDQSLANLSAQEFVRRILVDKLNALEIYESFNFNFGQGGKGDIALLRGMGAEYGFKVEQVPPVMLEGAPVSSSRVRKAVLAGDFVLGNRLLGRAYRFWGKVVHGAGRGGKLLNMPTANLLLNSVLLPPTGVYAAWAGLQGDEAGAAVFNLGLNPTFNEQLSEARLEVHVLDFSQDLYGREIWVEPVRFLRPELKFSSVEELMAQMERDVKAARALLAPQ